MRPPSQVRGSERTAHALSLRDTAPASLPEGRTQHSAGPVAGGHRGSPGPCGAREQNTIFQCGRQAGACPRAFLPGQVAPGRGSRWGDLPEAGLGEAAIVFSRSHPHLRFEVSAIPTL